MRHVTAFAGLAFLIAAACPAGAADYATGNVHMREGPGTAHRVIATVRAGAAVKIHGCTRGRRWCDATWRGRRGWVSGKYLRGASPQRRVRRDAGRPSRARPLVRNGEPSRAQTLFGHDQTLFGHDRSLFPDRF